MQKGRGRDLRGGTSPAPQTHFTMRPPAVTKPRTPLPQRPQPQPFKPEPDYEVVEFPSDQYVNAKLQPPPPPPPRPPTGHPAQAGASCGLCGGGGARVRCAECGRRALCASCDDMYHRHPKRRHHQRQALSPSQLSEVRPPLPPKTVAPPVPPPRRNKMSASPKPPMQDQQWRASPGHATLASMRAQPLFNQQPLPVHIQNKLAASSHMASPNNISTPSHMGNPNHLGSMPFLNTMPHQPAMQPQPMQMQSNTLGHLNPAWNRPRGSLQGFNVPQMAGGTENWESGSAVAAGAGWGGMRRGASVLELGGGAGGGAGGGCAHCAPAAAWRYGSCASLDHPWAPPGGGWQPPAACCAPHPHHAYPHAALPTHTPQPYRRADSRTMSRAASRTGSRAASPALSSRSRTSRRTKHRTPSPPLPSSDADSESESEEEPPARRGSKSRPASDRDRGEDAFARRGSQSTQSPRELQSEPAEESIGPAPPPPAAAWQCEHCTYVNEPGVRVCAVCCRTPTAAPKVVADVTADFERLSIKDEAPHAAARVRESPRVEVRAPEKPKRTEAVKSNEERTSTGCGPSPPRERSGVGPAAPRLITPTREQNGAKERHDMGVGPSPPRDSRNATNASSLREYNKTVRVSPYRETKETPTISTPQRHSVSVGPSPPRETRHSVSVGPSPPKEARHSVSVGPSPPKEARHSVSVGPSPPKDQTRDPIPSNVNFQKKSAGTSPPRDIPAESRSSAQITKTNVSNTGTSPPPQNISTQTYEEPSAWERGSSGAAGAGARAAGRARSRSRRLRDDARRERSHSRHSLSSDTRESERSVRTAGAGWEWRERDGSPPDAEWGRLARRASHLDLRRPRQQRRSSFYGSEATSPEPVGGRALSVEALAGGRRGVELARLLADAERLGYDAAEVQVGLEASPGAPLAWLEARWAGLAGAVRGAAARLAPHATLSERDARAALARHRGAVWPAVTYCVDALRTQESRVGTAARVRGRVWGSPAGADDEAAPRARAEYSSDEYDPPAGPYADEWGPPALEREERASWDSPAAGAGAAEVARTLRSLLARADDAALLRTLLRPDRDLAPPSLDLIRSENDFIDAYNALTRASPLPNISEPAADRAAPEPAPRNARTDHDYARRDDRTRGGLDSNVDFNNERNEKETRKQKSSATVNDTDNRSPELTPHDKREPKKAKITILKSENPNALGSADNRNVRKPIAVKPSYILEKDRNETKSLPQTQNLPQEGPQVEEKSSNLNEIVDNTQKLIQQMKDEINSDINSLDDGHAQTSQSEHETSSNDEREESYSETEEETDNMSSDDNEGSNEEYEEEEVDENSKNDATFPNRTSSEDNEQFEEALDNLDTQIEDVKHANIEILDSIARSLQEEHIMTIEINEPNKNIVTMVEKNNNIDSVQSNTNIKEDPNNNLFVAVNSFDEIYAELNTSTKNLNETIQTEPLKPLDVNVVTAVSIKPKILLTKYVIEEFALEPIAPTMLQISEIVEPTFNAIVDTVQLSAESDDENEIESATAGIVDNEITINGRSNSLSTESEPSQNDDIIDAADETTTTIEIIHVEIEEATPAPMEDIVNNTTDENITDDSDEKIIENTLFRESVENLIQSPKHRDSVEKVIQTPIHRESAEKILQSLTSRDSEEKVLQSPTDRVSVEKGIEIETPNDNTSNKTMIAKSNIPKPIKPTPNIKAKVDKLAPKLIVSKVPVRRTSIKQYPAPAPPKTHFGNVQIGHVKQLQSKIFNSPKPVKPQAPVIVDVKPSTSTATLNKKKPAPLPPGKQQGQKLATPPKSSPPQEKKKNYFKETCRTEDEWTDSDSEDSQSQAARPTEPREEEPPARPSPPPPVTLRRVSGQIIDLASVQLPEGSPERQARLLLAGGALETWEQARLAVELVARGAAPPAAMLAALECADLPAALAYLHQDCELCAARLPEHEMVSMLRCTHRCCRECARLYFTVQITERSIADCVCPYCKVPELEALPEDAWLEYFAHLDILLKTLLETDVHELFQRKLRDRTLARDPNFRWCMECSSGFFVHPKQKKLRCPECRSVSCASCRKPWSPNHEGLSCEQYATWVEDNDPERSVAAVQQHLRENGLECPRCRFKYSLSRGGCMHFTCTQCKYEFCYGCGKPFTMGARCGLSEYCGKLGLHAHHPRNCLFYLRDKEPHELQTLLQMNNVSYETEAAEGSAGRCPIQLQRETPAGLVDGVCGHEAPPNSAGLCKPHYVEYLAARARTLDPIPIMHVSELVAELRRRALPLPERGPWDTDPLYAGMCAEIVREKIPLD